MLSVLFYAISDQKALQPFTDAYRQFAEELAPYHARWLSMNGGLLGQQGTEDGCKMTTISDENDLDRFRNSISYPTCSKCKIYAAPGKALANFAVSTRNIDKMWKEQIAKFIT